MDGYGIGDSAETRLTHPAETFDAAADLLDPHNVWDGVMVDPEGAAHDESRTIETSTTDPSRTCITSREQYRDQPDALHRSRTSGKFAVFLQIIVPLWPLQT